MQRGLSLPQEELVINTARLFGFQRTGAKSRPRILEAIALNERNGVFRRTGETIALA